jgi:hypothetical protein
LVILVLICGIHVSGIHHDSDGEGLAFVDRVATLLFIVVLGVALAASSRRRGGLPMGATVRSEISGATAVDVSSFRMVVPLRC